MVEIFPKTRPLASRIVALDPFCCTLLIMRPPASRKALPVPVCAAVPSVRPEASR